MYTIKFPLPLNPLPLRCGHHIWKLPYENTKGNIIRSSSNVPSVRINRGEKRYKSSSSNADAARFLAAPANFKSQRKDRDDNQDATLRQCKESIPEKYHFRSSFSPPLAATRCVRDFTILGAAGFLLSCVAGWLATEGRSPLITTTISNKLLPKK